MTIREQAQKLYDSGLIDDTISIIDSYDNRAYAMQDTTRYHSIEDYIKVSDDVYLMDLSKVENANMLRLNLLKSLVQIRHC